MHVTVAICTYNRAALLDQTLATFRDLIVPSDISWDVLVIDNNCSDETPQVVGKHRAHLPVSCVEERTPGLCAARNKAAAIATGELILFTDDDVLVDEMWLVEYVKASRAWREAAYFGGTVTPWFPVAPPGWVWRNLVPLSEPYALANHGEEVRMADNRPIVGANMGFRTAVLRANPFDVRIGQVGMAALRGDETELLGRLRKQNLRGVWVGTARLRHYVQPSRMTTNYLWHWYSGLGVGVAREEGIQPCTTLFGAPRWAIRELAFLYLRYLILSLRRNETWIRCLRQAGVLRGYIAEWRRLSSAQSSGRNVQQERTAS